MSENAASLIGNDFKLQLGDGNSPEQYEDFCATFELGELGEEAPLIDITTFCSSAREYRNGLPDGVEIPLRANFTQGDEQIRTLYLAFKNSTSVNLRFRTKDSPADTWDFTAIVRAWRIQPTVGERGSANFTLKVSGSVTWTEGS